MEIYVLQVLTGKEKIIRERISGIIPGGRIIFPGRELIQRKRGKSYKKIQPLFPGYLFYETDGLPDAETIRNITAVENVARFLPVSANPLPLEREEAKRLSLMLKKDGITPLVPVFFNENDRIVITEGPLKGMEGRIVKVDRRKRRMRIRLDLYKDSHLVDFGYKDVGKGS